MKTLDYNKIDTTGQKVGGLLVNRIKDSKWNSQSSCGAGHVKLLDNRDWVSDCKDKKILKIDGCTQCK